MSVLLPIHSFTCQYSYQYIASHVSTLTNRENASFGGMGFDDGGSDDEDGRPHAGSKQSTEAKYV